MYTPISIDVFCSAFAGAIGGYQKGRNPHSAITSQYARVAEAALAFASAFDAEFAVVLPNELQLQEIETLAAEIANYPNNATTALLPATYEPLCDAIIAMMSEASTVIAANVPTPIPVPTPISAVVTNVPTVAGSGLMGTTVPASLIAVVVDGYYVPGDGGGGVFFWNPTSNATDNQGTVINPAAHVGAGRWIRIYSGELNVLWFGCKGIGATFNDGIPLQNLINYCAGLPISPVIFFPACTAGNFYKINATLTIPGSLSQTFRFVGETTNAMQTGCSAIHYAGGAGTTMIDIVGGNDVKIEHIDLVCGGFANKGIWYRPDQVAPLGADNLVLDDCNISGIQDAVGSACIAIGPIAGVPNQADLLAVYNSRLAGDPNNATHRGVGFRNLSGGNAKVATFVNVRCAGLKYAFDFSSYTGPVTLWEPVISACNGAGLHCSSTRIACYGLDFETNYANCKILDGTTGDGTGNVSFYDSELFYQDTAFGDTPTNDVAISWSGGALSFQNTHIQNIRSLTITATTNANPDVLTVGAGHNVVVGDRVQIVGSTGDTGPNTAAGKFTTVTAIGATTITIDQAGNGVYAGGGTVHFEPKIEIVSANVGTGNPKAGVDSSQSTWANCASNLPIFDQGTGLRITDYSQTLPNKIRSFGDVGLQPGATAPNDLLPMKSPDWSPGNLGHVLAAYAASDGVTLVAGAVSQWNDPYNAHNLAQVTPNKRPAPTASGLAGWPYVTGDGVNDELNAAFANPRPVTIYVVAKYNTNASNQVILDGATVNTGRMFRLDQITLDCAAVALDPTNLDLQNWHAHAMVLNGANSSYQQENNVITTGATGAAALGGLTLFALGSAAGFWGNVSIAEVWVFNIAHTQSEIDLVESYLAEKYALPTPIAIQQMTNNTGAAAATQCVDVTTAGVSDPAKVNANFASVIVALQKAGLWRP